MVYAKALSLAKRYSKKIHKIIFYDVPSPLYIEKSFGYISPEAKRRTFTLIPAVCTANFYKTIRKCFMNRRAFLTSTGVAATVVALPQNRSTAKNGDEMKRPMLNEKLGSRKGLPDLQPAPRRVLAGLEPYVPTPQQPWDRRRIEYLLRRTTFGAKREHVDLALTKTPGEIVDTLLADQPAPTAPLWVTEKPSYNSKDGAGDQSGHSVGRLEQRCGL